MRGSPWRRVLRKGWMSSSCQALGYQSSTQALHSPLVSLALPFCELQVQAHDWSRAQHLPQTQHLELWALHWTPWSDLIPRTRERFCLGIPVSDHLKTAWSGFLSSPPLQTQHVEAAVGQRVGFQRGHAQHWAHHCVWLIPGGVSVQAELRPACRALPEHTASAPPARHREQGVWEAAARTALPGCITRGCPVAQSNADTEWLLNFTVFNYYLWLMFCGVT